MTASPDRRRASAHSLCTGGTLLALACARNVFTAIDRRSPEAGALATWLGQSATAFGLPDSALPSDGDEPGRSRRRGVNLQDWRKIRLALNLAVADLPSTVDSPAERWIAAIGEALRLDPLAKRILALAIHYKVDQRVERLFDGISACRGGHSMLHRDAGLFGLLLDKPTAEVAAQFSAHAKLLASGLLHLDEHGQLSVLDRLQSLIRQDVLPAADFYDQVLGSIEADPLPWDSFAHLGREAEIAVSLLQATLAGGETGVSCSGAQSKCVRRAIKGGFRRRLAETIGCLRRTFFETERTVVETDARSNVPTQNA